MKYILLLLLLLLASCAAPQYDGTVYSKLVDVAVATNSPADTCGKLSAADMSAVITLQSTVDYIQIYISGKPHNNDMAVMLTSLKSEITRFQNTAHTGKMSSAYCIDKIMNIHDIAMRALKAEGSTQ